MLFGVRVGVNVGVLFGQKFEKFPSNLFFHSVELVFKFLRIKFKSDGLIHKTILTLKDMWNKLLGAPPLYEKTVSRLLYSNVPGLQRWNDSLVLT